MLMDSFEVENFRSLKHLKLEKLARVNLLVGKNNSGKTSVLEAIFLLQGAGGHNGLAIIEHERGLKEDENEFRQLFYQFNFSNSVKVTITHREENALNKILDATVTLAVASQKNEVLGGRKSLAVSAKAKASVLQFKVQLSTAGIPFYFTISRGNDHKLRTTDQFVEKSGKSDEEMLFPANDRHLTGEILTTTIDRLTLSQKLEALKVGKLDAALLRILQAIDPRIKSISLGGGGQIYLDLGDSFPTLLPLNLMGEGIQRLLDVTSAVANNAGGIVLIDEIDNGLHYSALRILWKGILQAAREYDVQIVATTHSAEALRHLTRVLDEEENASYRDDVAAYTLIRADDDTVRSYRYDYEQLDYALDHGLEVRN